MKAPPINKETEELYKELMGIWSAPESVNRDITIQILKICKEAGLKFVGKELTLPPIKNPNAQIKEIEV